MFSYSIEPRFGKFWMSLDLGFSLVGLFVLGTFFYIYCIVKASIKMTLRKLDKEASDMNLTS